jgi:FixJ family two-component response regulator
VDFLCTASVQGYFQELSDSLWATILLQDVEGLTSREIAEVLEISLDAAKVRLHRARKQVRHILEGSVFSSTSRRSGAGEGCLCQIRGRPVLRHSW